MPPRLSSGGADFLGHTVKALDMIVNHWAPTFTKLYGHHFPRSYLCWDTEYTGGNAEKDLIMEIGHCMVEDGVVVDRLNVVLDWSLHPEVPNEWIRKRLRRVEGQMGPRWRIRWDVMKEEGIHPVKALEFYYRMFKVWSDRGLPFVAHNGYKADERMFAGNCEGFLVKRFSFHDNELIDSGAIHKATVIWNSRDPLHSDLRGRVLPTTEDTMRSYFKRVANVHAKGVFWRMEHCLEQYGLIEKYDLDVNNLHTAEYDAYCTHLLMEEYRSRVTQNNSGESPTDSPEAFSRMFDEEMAKTKLAKEEAQRPRPEANSEARARLREKRRRRKQRAV